MHHDTDKRIFLAHLALYVVVNAVLVAINLMQPVTEGGARNYWFVWPLLGWGIGVAAHGLIIYMEKAARPGSAMADPRIRGLAIHAFAYVCVNILLIVVDVTTTPGKWWFYWPLLGWGIGLLSHALAVRRDLRKSKKAQPAP